MFSFYRLKRFYDTMKEYLDLDRGIFVICATLGKLQTLSLGFLTGKTVSQVSGRMNEILTVSVILKCKALTVGLTQRLKLVVFTEIGFRSSQMWFSPLFYRFVPYLILLLIFLHFLKLF